MKTLKIEKLQSLASPLFFVEVHDETEKVWEGTIAANSEAEAKDLAIENAGKLNQPVKAYTKTYADFRREAYPEIVDQLDILYHQGIDGWKAAIKAVKDKFPKG